MGDIFDEAPEPSPVASWSCDAPNWHVKSLSRPGSREVSRPGSSHGQPTADSCDMSRPGSSHGRMLLCSPSGHLSGEVDVLLASVQSSLMEAGSQASPTAETPPLKQQMRSPMSTLSPLSVPNNSDHTHSPEPSPGSLPERTPPPADISPGTKHNSTSPFHEPAAAKGFRSTVPHKQEASRSYSSGPSFSLRKPKAVTSASGVTDIVRVNSAGTSRRPQTPEEASKAAGYAALENRVKNADKSSTLYKLYVDSSILGAALSKSKVSESEGTAAHTGTKDKARVPVTQVGSRRSTALSEPDILVINHPEEPGLDCSPGSAHGHRYSSGLSNTALEGSPLVVETCSPFSPLASGRPSTSSPQPAARIRPKTCESLVKADSELEPGATHRLWQQSLLSRPPRPASRSGSMVVSQKPDIGNALPLTVLARETRPSSSAEARCPGTAVSSVRTKAPGVAGKRVCSITAKSANSTRESSPVGSPTKATEVSNSSSSMDFTEDLQSNSLKTRVQLTQLKNRWADLNAEFATSLERKGQPGSDSRSTKELHKKIISIEREIRVLSSPR